jgi:hypothetical protein
MGWSCPPLNRKWCDISRTVEILTPKLYIFLFSCQGTSDVMLVMTIWGGSALPHPLKQEVLCYLENVEIPTPKPYIFLFLVSRNI